MSAAHPAICRNCIGAVTSGSLVAIVSKLRNCPSCLEDIAHNGSGPGYRMLLLSFNRFNSHLIAEEWEQQNLKEWVHIVQSRYAPFGLVITHCVDSNRMCQIKLVFKSAPGGSNLSVEIRAALLPAAIQKADAWLVKMTKDWPLVPDKTRTNTTGAVLRQKPSFDAEEG